MNKTGYSKTLVTHVKRVTHTVTFHEGMRKESIASLIAKVPDDAILHEINDGCDDGGIAQMHFIEETVDGFKKINRVTGE
jgi:hypothetical protein